MTHAYVRPGPLDPRRLDFVTLAILTWHVRAEEFDRELDGSWWNGEWMPEPGQPMSASLRNAARLEREARMFCRERGVTRREWESALERVRVLTYAEKCLLLADMQKARRDGP